MRPPSPSAPGARLLSLVAVVASLVAPALCEPSCHVVSAQMRQAAPQLKQIDFFEQPLNAANGNGGSCGCCGSTAAFKLSANARRELKNTVRVQATKLHTSFGGKAKHFDDVFLELLARSKIDLHKMFTRTYGLIYEKHAQLFASLFSDLERYYKKGDLDLARMMDDFFSVLYKKMFTVLNSQYNFDEKYLSCVSEHMRELQPFGDVPQKLATQVKRAFVATRTFTRSLNAAAEVAKIMGTVQPAGWCGANDHCGLCSGSAEGPCPYLCINRVRACLPQHADLSLDWNTFVDAMDKVSDRLLGPFNIAVVVEPINVKISEAIMNFQERSHELSQRVFTGCGKPVLGQKTQDSGYLSHSRQTRSASINRVKSLDHSDDFEIETSYESLLTKNPFLLSRGNSRKQFPDYNSNIDSKAKDYVNFKLENDISNDQSSDSDRIRDLSRKIVFDNFMKMRSKRDANPDPGVNSKEIDFETYDWGNKGNNNKKKGNKDQGRGKKKKISSLNRGSLGSELDHDSDLINRGEQDDPLERLVRDIRKSVRESRLMWTNLPQIHCNINQKTQLSTFANEENCWNGTHTARYTLQLAGEGTAALATNPEAKGSSTTSSLPGVPMASIVTAQQFTLRSVSNKLTNAYNGFDVEWSENEEISSLSQGSGSGSGDDDTDNRPEPGGPIDQEDDLEGSGHHPDTRFEAKIPEEDVDTNSFNPSVVTKHTDSNVISVSNEDIDHNTIEHGGRPDHIDSNVKKDSGTSAASPKQEMSLQRALITYLFPIVCVWFGGIITDIA